MQDRPSEVMSVNNFKSICVSLNWEELNDFLGCNVKDLALKVFVSALIQTKHPDKKYQDEYGIAGCWDEKLSNIPVSPIASLFTSRVWLADFYKSYYIAEEILHGSSIDPKLVQNIIKDYVVKNKINLTGVLYSHKDIFSDSALADMNKIFGSLEISEQEKIRFDIQQNIARSTIKRQEMKSDERRQIIALQIDDLFDLEPGTCKLKHANNKLDPYTEEDDKLFKLASGTYATWQAKHTNDFDESNIKFNKKIDKKAVREFSDRLKKLDINVHYVCYPYYYNGDRAYIQLSSPLKDVIKKLDEAIIASKRIDVKQADEIIENKAFTIK